MAFPAIFIFVIGHVATATLPLPKPKLSRKIRIIKFGNHSRGGRQNIPHYFVINPGNHFTEPDMRLAKAIAHILT